MTETDAPTLTGIDIGQAERATRAVLDRLLAETETRFTTWVVLNTLATIGGSLDRAELRGRLVVGLKIPEAEATAIVDTVASAGLAMDGPDEVHLTDAGSALFQRIREGIAGITERLYGGLPKEDLQTAHRVLATVTARANAELT